MKTALVLGGHGFIGHHLCRRLKNEGYWVRSVDIRPWPVPDQQRPDEELLYDLRDPKNVEAVMRLETDHEFDYLPKPFMAQKPFDEVYQLAADMGGAGYIFTGEHDADVMHNSATINLNVCHWAKEYGVKKIFYSSSACMYPQELQQEKRSYLGNLSQRYSLFESDAYPANPDSEYGWEKLFSERLYLAYARNYGLNVRIARFHNIYGPEGTYKGGREKAPAAMCRKVIEKIGYMFLFEDKEGHHALEQSIDVWGTGNQTRSFLYIDDCIDAVRLLMQSEFKEPINIGSEEMVTINELAQMAIDLSGKNIQIKNIDGPVGVMGRNSDNTLIRKELNWEPKFSLKRGMERTFNWIKSQYGL